MPKYNGSNLDKVTPQFHNPNRPVPSNEQVNSWWDTVVNGVGSDKGIQQKIGDGKNLYFFNDEGDLVPALPKGANTADINVRRYLMAQSMDGRLFTRAFGKAAPRQVVTNPGDDFAVGLASGENPWDLPQPEPLERPEAPAFFKYLLYPFFRHEIRAYNQKQEAYDAYLRQGRWIRSIDGNDEHLIQDRAEDLTAPYREQKSKSQPEVEITQPVRSKDIANMTPEAFKQYLTEMSQHFDPNFRAPLRNNPNVTSDLYYDAVATQMECMIAKDMLALGESNPEYFSAEHRVVYQALANGLDGFVRSNLDLSLVNSFLEFGTDAPGFWDLASKESFLLSADGVDEYQKSIVPQNAEQEHLPQNEPPQKGQEAPQVNSSSPMNAM